MKNGTTTVGYQVEITQAGTPYPATHLSALTNLTSYTINGLQNGTNYQVRVTTVTDTGLGNAVLATGIPAGPASAPSGLAYTYDPTTANVSLTWSPPSNTGGLPITGWALNYCRVDAIAANSCVGTTANTTVLVANTFSSSANYTIPGLTYGGFGATMQYGVAPITSAGTGAFAFITVVQTKYIAAPTAAVTNNAFGASVVITSSATSGLIHTGDLIEIANPSTGGFTVFNSTPNSVWNSNPFCATYIASAAPLECERTQTYQFTGLANQVPRTIRITAKYTSLDGVTSFSSPSILVTIPEPNPPIIINTEYQAMFFTKEDVGKLKSIDHFQAPICTR
jgi:hypothetical protein